MFITTEPSRATPDTLWATFNGSGKGENKDGGWPLRLFLSISQKAMESAAGCGPIHTLMVTRKLAQGSVNRPDR